MFRRWSLSLYLLLFAFSVNTVYAQVATGQIAGSVSDATGARLPGVSVTITNVQTNLTRTAITDDRGEFIFIEFLYKPIDLEFLWRSYNGLRRFNHYRPSSPLTTGHFREYYPGGWHEMLPNGPGPCTHRGAEFGFHGEVDEPERVEVRFRVRTVRVPLHVEKALALDGGSATLRNEERLFNEAGQPVEVLWGHHPTFGWPFLEAGCRVFLPACRVRTGEDVLPGSRLAPAQHAEWPTAQSRDGERLDLSVIPGPEARSQDFIWIEGLSAGWYAIVNPAKQAGFALRWDQTVFPVLGFWQVFRGAADYPWYGMNYLIALEPACDLPSLSQAARNGTALRLEAEACLETQLEATAFRSPLEVVEVLPGGVVK